MFGLGALTNSEVQVLRLAAAGYSNNEIADAIDKSSGTVRNQMSFIFAKLQVRDRCGSCLFIRALQAATRTYS